MRNKFGAKKTKIGKQIFHSRLEAKHYLQLKMLEKAGKIRDMRTQVPYKLTCNNILICKYILDFQFYDNELGCIRYVDSKGVITSIFRIKKKFVEAQYGIIIELWKK